MTLRDTPKMVSSRLGDPDAYTLARYLFDGGYETLRRAVRDLSPKEVHDEVRASGLTGRSGGAAFPTTSKWDLLAKGDPRYLIINADESEPGFFKDRMLLERDRHEMLEGALLCAFVIGAPVIFVYVRGEFALGIERFETAVAEAYSHEAAGANIFGSRFSCDIVVHPGAGAYICGEETALIESLEGKRGFPRIKPPFFPAVRGLYGQPTISTTSRPWPPFHGLSVTAGPPTPPMAAGGLLVPVSSVSPDESIVRVPTRSNSTTQPFEIFFSTQAWGLAYPMGLSFEPSSQGLPFRGSSPSNSISTSTETRSGPTDLPWVRGSWFLTRPPVRSAPRGGS